MDPFARLDLPRELVLDREDLKARVEVLCRKHHPDTTGEGQLFEEILEASRILEAPASRLKAALQGAGGVLPERGSIPGEVMDFFSPVASLLEDFGKFVGERKDALSGLGRAVLDLKLPALKKRLEEMTGQLESLEKTLVDRFPEFDRRGWEECADEMAEVFRGLVFLGKWRSELREANGKLFEVLLGG